MCDKEHFHKLEGRVDKLELDAAQHKASADEKFNGFEKSLAFLITLFKWVFGAMFIVLLFQMFTVIYGAIGERGFNHVTNTAEEICK